MRNTISISTMVILLFAGGQAEDDLLIDGDSELDNDQRNAFGI